MAKEPEIIYSPQVQEQLKNDPKMKEFMKEMSAVLRQAMAGVESGQYKSFEDAMETLTGNRPTFVGPVDEDDELLEGGELSVEEVKKPDDTTK